MAAPRNVTTYDLDYWSGQNPRIAMFTAPEEIAAGVAPCLGIVTDDPADTDTPFGSAVRVPVQLNADEIEALGKGGTLWLSTWGGLPMWMIEIQP